MGIQGKRILIVDDDPTIRNILVQIFKLQGYDVEAAINGVDALDHLRAAERPIEAMITDMSMPIMDGRELIEKTQAEFPGLRIICLSASYSDVWLDLSVLFVPKPFSIRGIVALVKSALEGTTRREVKTG